MLVAGIVALFQCYVNSSKPKGLAIIFNNRRFDCPQLPERFGTDIDCTNMERLLKELGYHVKVENDLTAKVSFVMNVDSIMRVCG